MPASGGNRRPEYSLWTRDPEDELLALTGELGITFVAFSPLGRGFLSGELKSPDDLAPDDWRGTIPEVSLAPPGSVNRHTER